MSHCRKSPSLLALLALLVAGIALWSGSANPVRAAAGLVNPGFESGALNGDPVGWTVASRADAVQVDDTETPAEFPTYADMGNVTVSPYRGNLMLRLGTPQRLDANQIKGNNIVRQTFSSTTAKLDIAFRVFSWEHRGQDLVKIDVQDGTTPNAPSVGDLATPVQILRTNATVMATCSDIPCQFSMNTGNQGDYVDSGWLVLNVTNLPSDGRTLTLSYQVSGTKDASKATWAKFDNVNTPPVAKFSFTPSDPREGDVVQFLDLSYDPDPGDSIVSRTWVINGETFTDESPFFLFSDNANYVASIAVSDTSGAVSIVLDNATALDGDFVPDLVVENVNPLVNALNMEVLAGDELTLRGRFLDPGYVDRHCGTAVTPSPATPTPVCLTPSEWSITGNPAATVEEENDPLLSTGLVTGSLTPSTNLTGTLTVSDKDGGSGSDSFIVTVIPDSPASLTRHEPNDVADDPQNPPPILESDNAIVSFIQQDGDVDIYEVRAAQGAQIKPGSEMLISLTGLNADVDVAILAKLPTGASAGWNRTGWNRTGWNRTGFGESDAEVLGWNRTGWNRTGWNRTGWNRTGWNRTGWTFNNSGVSWSDIANADFRDSASGYQAGGNGVEATDVNLEELGLGQVGGDSIQVADFSANRGLDDETAWARAATPGSSFYVAVFTSDGEQSLTPYTLSAEIIEPPDLELGLGSLCDGSPLVTSGATMTPVVLHNYDDPLTIGVDDPATSVLVIQEQRVRVTYNMDDAAWNAFMGAADATGDAVGLKALAQHPKVRADIYSVPSVFFDNADVNKCNVDATNSVTTQIRDLLAANYPTAENYVLVGSDDIIPFRRALDYTIIGNEKNYFWDSFLKAGSKPFAAVLQGYMLTDDYYGDATGAPWQGDEAWVPTKGIGRLVETPTEIRAQALAAVSSNVTLNPATGSVFGYDFFTDGAEAIGDSLDAGLLGPVQREISNTWTKDDMRCVLLGIGADPKCGVRDLASPNGHSAHYGIQSANGSITDNFNDFVSSTEIATTGGGVPVLENTLVFTMGCHAGFSSPDGSSQGPDANSGTDPRLDLPQAMARQRAVYIASTGYGYGDTEVKAGHEVLMELLPQELLKGGVTVSEGMNSAKQKYLGGLISMTVYDMKVSMETTLYGLPMYTVDPVIASQLLAVPTQESLLATPVGNFALTTTDAGSTSPTVTTTHALESNTGPKGTSYALDGDSQAGTGRTLQPSFGENIDERHPYSGAPPPVHGVRITGATYSDITPHDPVFSRPKFEWEIINKQLEECQAGYSPSAVAEVNSFQRGPNLTQTLVGVAGQFRCTSGAAANVTGVERLYSSLSLDIRRCAGDNTDGPAVNDLELRDLGAGTVEVRVDTSDAGGISRIDVLRVDGGQIVPFSQTFTGPGFPTAGSFNINVSGVSQTTDLLIQVEDNECNVTLDTFKSAGLSFLTVDAGPDQLMPANRTVTLTGTVENFDDLVSPVWFDWEFGDGTFFDGVLLPVSPTSVSFALDAFGTATFSVQHTYAAGVQTPITATLEVHDSSGGNGSDETHIKCDPTGDAQGPDGDWTGCGSSNTSTQMTISVTVDAAVTDQYQYRVFVDAGKYNTKRKRWEQPPDGIFDAQLKYNGGQVNGLNSLTVQVVGNELRFTFDLSEFGLSSGKVVRWYAETQAGVPGQPATGQVDRMPDAGWLSHTVVP